jgi:hypothetical protein
MPIEEWSAEYFRFFARRGREILGIGNASGQHATHGYLSTLHGAMALCDP